MATINKTAAQINDFLDGKFDGTITLPAPIIGDKTNKIMMGEELFIHSYHAPNTDGVNLFIGRKAGNQTLARDTLDGEASVNLAIGYRSGEHLTKGFYNCFVGHWAGFENTSGANNTYIGDDAGYSASVANNCTIVGALAGFANVIGDGNTMIGTRAGRFTTIGETTIIGAYAGYNNLTSSVTLVGFQAGFTNTTGKIVAVGKKALRANTTGDATAVGFEAGLANTTGTLVAVGHSAGQANTTGYVTAVGHRAALACTTGRVTAIGYLAALKVTTGYVIAIGFNAGNGDAPNNAPVTDINGILIGQSANRSVASAIQLTNYCGIGSSVMVDKSNQFVFGNANVTEHLFRAGYLKAPGTPTYADNAAALAGGLTGHEFYKTATGELRIVIPV